MAERKPNEKEELDDLLDNALQDFDKTNSSTNSSELPKPASVNGADEDGAGAASHPDAFFIDQTQIFLERMKTLFGGPNTPSGDVPPLPQDPDKIMAGFKKRAEAFALTVYGVNPANDYEVAKYSDSISQAFKGLPVSDTDIVNMFEGLNLDGATEGDGNMFLPFMEGMIQSVLSAEILLPSLKELIEKYPKYLAENGEKISAEDRERFEKQLELYKVLEQQLEIEKPDDTPVVKRKTFKVVSEHIRRLQEYGQPPEEILAQCPMM